MSTNLYEVNETGRTATVKHGGGNIEVLGVICSGASDLHRINYTLAIKALLLSAETLLFLSGLKHAPKLCQADMICKEEQGALTELSLTHVCEHSGMLQWSGQTDGEHALRCNANVQ